MRKCYLLITPGDPDARGWREEECKQIQHGPTPRLTLETKLHCVASVLARLLAPWELPGTYRLFLRVLRERQIAVIGT